MATKTIAEKIAFQEAKLVDLNAQNATLTRKIQACYTQLTKLGREATADKYTAFLSATDPQFVDWEYVTSQGSASPRSIDRNQVDEKINTLFGGERVSIANYRDFKTNETAFAFRLTLKVTGYESGSTWDDDDTCEAPGTVSPEDRATFASAVRIATDASTPLFESIVGQKFDEGDVPSDHVMINIFTRRCSDDGCQFITAAKDHSGYTYGRLYYHSIEIIRKFDTLDALIDWMVANEHTYDH